MNWKQLSLYAIVFVSVRALFGFVEGLLFPSPQSLLWGVAVSFAVATSVFAHFCARQRSRTLLHATFLLLSAALIDIAIYQATLKTALVPGPFELALGWLGLFFGALVGTAAGITFRGKSEGAANVA